MPTVDLSQDVAKFLRKLPAATRARITTRLRRLASDPIPRDAKFIGRYAGDRVFRVRIGDYRALYVLKDADDVVLVTRLDKRERVYQ